MVAPLLPARLPPRPAGGPPLPPRLPPKLPPRLPPAPAPLSQELAPGIPRPMPAPPADPALAQEEARRIQAQRRADFRIKLAQRMTPDQGSSPSRDLGLRTAYGMWGALEPVAGALSTPLLAGAAAADTVMSPVRALTGEPQFPATRALASTIGETFTSPDIAEAGTTRLAGVQSPLMNTVEDWAIKPAAQVPAMAAMALTPMGEVAAATRVAGIMSKMPGLAKVPDLAVRVQAFLTNAKATLPFSLQQVAQGDESATKAAVRLVTESLVSSLLPGGTEAAAAALQTGKRSAEALIPAVLKGTVSEGAEGGLQAATGVAFGDYNDANGNLDLAKAATGIGQGAVGEAIGGGVTTALVHGGQRVADRLTAPAAVPPPVGVPAPALPPVLPPPAAAAPAAQPVVAPPAVAPLVVGQQARTPAGGTVTLSALGAPGQVQITDANGISTPVSEAMFRSLKPVVAPPAEPAPAIVPPAPAIVPPAPAIVPPAPAIVPPAPAAAPAAPAAPEPVAAPVPVAAIPVPSAPVAAEPAPALPAKLPPRPAVVAVATLPAEVKPQAKAPAASTVPPPVPAAKVEPAAQETNETEAVSPDRAAWAAFNTPTGTHKMEGKQVSNPDTGVELSIAAVYPDGSAMLTNGHDYEEMVPFDELKSWTVNMGGEDTPLLRVIQNRITPAHQARQQRAKPVAAPAAKVEAPAAPAPDLQPAAKPAAPAPDLQPAAKPAAPAPAPAPVSAAPQTLAEKHVTKAREAGMADPVPAKDPDAPNQKTGLLGGHGEIVVEGSLMDAAVSTANDKFGVFVGFHPDSGKWIVFGMDPQRRRKAAAGPAASILTPTQPTDTALLTGRSIETQSRFGEALRGETLYRQNAEGQFDVVGKVDTTPKPGRDLFDTKAEAIQRATYAMANRHRANRKVDKKAVVAQTEVQRDQIAAEKGSAEEPGALREAKNEFDRKLDEENRAGDKVVRELATKMAHEAEITAALETKFAEKMVELHQLTKQREALQSKMREVRSPYIDQIAKIQEKIRATPRTSDSYTVLKKDLKKIAAEEDAAMQAAGLGELEKTGEELAKLVAEKDAFIAAELKFLEDARQRAKKDSVSFSRRPSVNPTRAGFFITDLLTMPFSLLARRQVAPPLTSMDPDVRAEFLKNQGQQPAKRRFIEETRRTLQAFTHAIPELDRKKDAVLVDKLVVRRAAAAASVMRAQTVVRDILAPVPEHLRNFFRECVVVQNLYFDHLVLGQYHEAAAEIPMFGTGDEGRRKLTENMKRIQTLLADPKHKVVVDALAHRAAMVENEITEPLITMGSLDATQRGRPWYHQMALDVHNLRELLPRAGAASKAARGAAPGMTKGRSYSGAAFNTLYEQAEIVSFASSYMTQEEASFSEYLGAMSRTNRIVGLAQKENVQRATEAVAKADPEHVFSGLNVVAWWVNSGRDTAPFAAHDRILKELGAAYPLGKVQAVINDKANAGEIAALHQELLKRNGPLQTAWMGGAKVDSGHERYGILGARGYTNPREWSEGARMLQILDQYNQETGEDLVAFHYHAGNDILMSEALTPEQKLKWDAELDTAARNLGRPLSAAERASFVHSLPGVGVQSQMILSAEKPPLVVPRAWRDAIEYEEVRLKKTSNQYHKVVGRVSVFLLRNPLTVSKWVASQITSNTMMSMMANPQSFRQWPAAAKILAKFTRHQPVVGPARKILDDAIRHGVLKTGGARSMENMGDEEVRELMQMSSAIGQSFPKRVLKHLGNLATTNYDAMNVAVALSDDLPKLAIYMELIGKPPAEIAKAGWQWGISSKAQLETMLKGGATAQELAAKIASEATGNYLATSPNGNAMARNLAPFYRWIEASSFVAFRQLANLRYAFTDPSISQTVSLAYKLAVLTATSGILVSAFNRLVWGDDDAESLDKSGGPASLIVGKSAEGRVITVPLVSVLQDVASRFGLHDVLTNDTRVVTPGTMATTYAFKMLDQMGSVPKSALRLATGLTWNSYQNTFRQAPVRNAHEAAVLALETVGLRMIARQVDPNTPIQPFAFSDLIATSRFPEDMDFFAGRRAVMNVANRLYPDEGFDVQKPGSQPSPSDMAFRNFIQAVRSDDEDAAVSALSQYFAGGKQYGSFAESIRARGVFNGISNEKQKEIRAALTDAERKLLESAEAAYADVAKSPLLERALARSLVTNQQHVDHAAAKARAMLQSAAQEQAAGVPIELVQTQEYLQAKEFLKAKTALTKLQKRLAGDPDNADLREAVTYAEDYLDEQLQKAGQ